MSLIKFTGYKSNNNQLKQFQDKLVRQTEREYKIIQKTCKEQLFCILRNPGEQSDLLSVFIFSYYILNSCVRT